MTSSAYLARVCPHKDITSPVTSSSNSPSSSLTLSLLMSSRCSSKPCHLGSPSRSLASPHCWRRSSWSMPMLNSRGARLMQMPWMRMKMDQRASPVYSVRTSRLATYIARRRHGHLSSGFTHHPSSTLQSQEPFADYHCSPCVNHVHHV